MARPPPPLAVSPTPSIIVFASARLAPASHPVGAATEALLDLARTVPGAGGGILALALVGEAVAPAAQERKSRTTRDKTAAHFGSGKKSYRNQIACLKPRSGKVCARSQRAHSRCGIARHSHRSGAPVLIDGYSTHVAGDETIAALDKNPFVPLATQKMMTATLAALSKVIR
jgi:hypothetical protein